MMLQSPSRSTKLPIQAYAVQFLRDKHVHVCPSQSEAPKTPDNVSDVDMLEISWDDHLTEVSINFCASFYIKLIYLMGIEI